MSTQELIKVARDKETAIRNSTRASDDVPMWVGPLADIFITCTEAIVKATEETTEAVGTAGDSVSATILMESKD